jgi:hypothetical protein
MKTNPQSNDIDHYIVIIPRSLQITVALSTFVLEEVLGHFKDLLNF